MRLLSHTIYISAESVYSWIKFLKIAGVDVRAKKMVNGIKAGDKTPDTPKVEPEDDVEKPANSSFITRKELDSLATEEINGRVIKMISERYPLSGNTISIHVSRSSSWPSFGALSEGSPCLLALSRGVGFPEALCGGMSD